MVGLIGIISKKRISENLFVNFSNILRHYKWQKIDSKNFGKIMLGRVHINILNKEKQPIFNKKNNKCIIFEGYLYDCDHLKNHIKFKGYKLKYRNSYPEIALYSYEIFGDKCVDYLKGAFSFAIYDFGKKELILINDRFGLRPLYYTNSIKDKFIFSSEIKGILVDPNFKRKVNKKAIFDLITTGWVIGDEVLFKNIFFLPPASILKYKHGKIELKQYWDFEFEPKHSKDFNILKTELNSIFHNAMKSIIEQNPKLKYGVFLSGGLDSRFIASNLSKIKSKFITFNFGHKKFTDSKIAKKISKKLKNKHVEVDFNFKVLPKYLNDIVWLNEGLYNARDVWVFYYYNNLRKKIDCNFSGTGGDVLASDRWFYVPVKVNDIDTKTLRKIMWLDQGINVKHLLNIKEGNDLKFNKRILKYGLEEFFTYYYFKSRCQHFILYNTVVIKNNFFENITPFFNYEYFDFMTKIPYKFKNYKKLYRKAIYAFPELSSVKWKSFKLNTPFLNYKIFEIYKNILNLIKRGIRKYLKIDLTQPKYDLSNAIRNDNYFKEYIYEKLSSEKFKNRKIFNFEEVQRVIADHTRNRYDHTQTITMLLTIESWFEEYVDQKYIEPKILS